MAQTPEPEHVEQHRAGGEDASKSQSSAKVTDFTIGQMRPDEYDECVDIAAEAFCTNNPAVKHVGIPHDLYRDVVRITCTRKKVVDSGLSLVARDTVSGKPLAFLFIQVADPRTKYPDELFERHKGLLDLKDLIEGLYEDAIMHRKRGLRLGSLMCYKTLHIAMGGTFPGVNGKGIGFALRKEAVQIARDRKFAAIIVEPGHPATEHIWTNKLGFQMVAKVELDSFQTKAGERILEGVSGNFSICQLVLQDSFRDYAIMRPYFIAKVIVVTPRSKK